MKKKLEARIKFLEKKLKGSATSIAGRGMVAKAQKEVIEDEISFLKNTLKEGESKNWLEKLAGI